MPSQKILGMISAERAERVLLDWANLSELPDRRGHQWIASRHPEVFGFVASDDKKLERLAQNVGRYLPLAWDATDTRERDWYIFTARQEYERGRLEVELRKNLGPGIGRELIPGLPEVTPGEAALFHLTRIAYRMRHCPNPDCPAPYFFRAVGKKVQKFCSPECGDPSRRESKRLSWQRNGNRWRAENRRAASKSS